MSCRRLARVLVQAAVTGLGAAIGRPMLIARELESRTLVPLFDRRAEAPERCCLITTAAARQRPEVPEPEQPRTLARQGQAGSSSGLSLRRPILLR